MTYRVLPLKWRPKRFEEIIGQDTVIRTIMNAISMGKIANAYLFAGPRGVGKTTTARILARALNCEKGITPEPCNTCPICVDINAGHFMDVLEIDGASNRGIDQVRELREAVKYSPSRGRYKIYIIDEVHMLTTEAFNALLKTLEEPPSHTVFILATTELHKVIPTVQSRCQRFEFRRIPPATIFNKLKEISEAEGLDVEDEALRLIARYADGSLRDAIVFLDQMISFSKGRIREEDVRELLGISGKSFPFLILRAIVKGNAADAIDALNRAFDGTSDIKFLYRTILEHLRDLLIYKISGEKGDIFLSQEELKELGQLASSISTEDAHRYLTLALSSEFEITRTSFGKEALEALLVKLCTVKKIAPLDDILNRLEAIEKALQIQKERTHPEESPHPQEIIKEEKTIENYSKGWDDLLKFIRENKPTLLDTIISAKEIIEGEEGIINLPVQDFLVYRENEEFIRKAFREFLNREVRIVSVKRNDIHEKGGEGERESDLERRIRKEILEHPAVVEAIKVFEGNVEEVKISGGRIKRS